MPQICHAHCPKSGGGLGLLAAIVAVVVLAVTSRPVLRAAELAAEVAVWALASLTVLSVLSLVTWAVLRRRSRHRAQVVAALPAPRVTRVVRGAVTDGRERIVIPLTAITGPGESAPGHITGAQDATRNRKEHDMGLLTKAAAAVEDRRRQQDESELEDRRAATDKPGKPGKPGKAAKAK